MLGAVVVASFILKKNIKIFLNDLKSFIKNRESFFGVINKENMAHGYGHGYGAAAAVIIIIIIIIIIVALFAGFGHGGQTFALVAGDDDDTVAVSKSALHALCKH